MTPQIHPLIILFAAIFTNNILLTNFLGICSFVALSKRLDVAFGMGMAVTFVSTFTAGINWLIHHFVLQKGALVWLLGDRGRDLSLDLFSVIIFIAVIAAFVQIVEMVMERFFRSLYQALGIFLPLITVNCAILGVSLFLTVRHYSFLQSVAYGFGSGAGYTLAIVLMAALRRRLRYSNIPKPLEGIGITMIVTGIMAMAFMAFNGMVAVQ
ncbi:NADH:ubiquinone reductase (Na(+)-transporting) subunit E [Myxococcota bacterium]|nr:NADH:ubiquinone reductase (Na(+)-transporting) subunit E [Myxococcota bacterium]